MIPQFSKTVKEDKKYLFAHSNTTPPEHDFERSAWFHGEFSLWCRKGRKRFATVHSHCIARNLNKDKWNFDVAFPPGKISAYAHGRGGDKIRYDRETNCNNIRLTLLRSDNQADRNNFDCKDHWMLKKSHGSRNKVQRASKKHNFRTKGHRSEEKLDDYGCSTSIALKVLRSTHGTAAIVQRKIRTKRGTRSSRHRSKIRQFIKNSLRHSHAGRVVWQKFNTVFKTGVFFEKQLCTCWINWQFKESTKCQTTGAGRVLPKRSGPLQKSRSKWTKFVMRYLT